MTAIVSNLDKHYVAVRLAGTDDKDVLKQMASALYEEGYVKESYSDAILKREEVFPTGLPTGEINVAVPHTDPEHVNQAGFCLGVLDKPVTFNVMGMEGQTVDVSVVFMLAIKHKEDQMDTLGKLFETCQNQETLKKLLSGDCAVIETVMGGLSK